MSLSAKIMKELEYKPCRLKELKNRLGGDGKKVERLLASMVLSGRVAEQDGLYSLPAKKSAQAASEEGIPCTMVKLSRTFGFAMRQDGTADIFIPGRCLLGAMPGDQVLVKLFEHPRVEGSQEGEVVKITQPCQNFVGTVREEEGKLYLEPDQCTAIHLLIKKGADGGARAGEKAAVEILQRGRRHDEHRVGVSMRFGSADVARQCAKAILFAHDVHKHFPDEVKAEAQALEQRGIRAEDKEGRLDLRELPIFTIDSASTKDIDDAISVSQTAEGGFQLGVHIADVSHYVQPGSALDADAFQRGTSVYYADKVVPMLPRQLSNGLCSLNEKEERLAFSCLMELNAKGEILSSRFAKTVIRSRVKGVYSEINALLDGSTDEALTAKYAEVSGQFPAIRALYDQRVARRDERGGMDIASNESKLILDEDGRCIDVQKAERGISEAMIEEMMLLANQCAAMTARKAEVPFVYRVHEAPDEDRMARLSQILLTCGVNAHFAGKVPTQLELSKLLDESRDTPLERAVHSGILRSMAKAKYEPEPKGHYGLALADYAHFTSPIRRYADLAIHRILTCLAAGESKETVTEHFTEFVQKASQQASEREVNALQVERSCEDCYKAEFLRGHLGEKLEGVIGSVAPHGIYVELPNTVEGLVHITNLSATRPVLTEGVCLTDPVSGKKWALGDEVKVVVAKTDVALGKIDFLLAD